MRAPAQWKSPQGRLKTAPWGAMPHSGVQTAKRSLVAVLKSLARAYGVAVELTRDAADTAVRAQGGGRGGRDARGGRRWKSCGRVSVPDESLEVSRECPSGAPGRERSLDVGWQ